MPSLRRRKYPCIFPPSQGPGVKWVPRLLAECMTQHVKILPGAELSSRVLSIQFSSVIKMPVMLSEMCRTASGNIKCLRKSELSLLFLKILHIVCLSLLVEVTVPASFRDQLIHWAQWGQIYFLPEKELEFLNSLSFPLR